jgi:hypothetical protein
VADKTKKKGTKRRTQVKDLPKKKGELSAAEAKKVKGGIAIGIVVIGLDKPPR